MTKPTSFQDELDAKFERYRKTGRMEAILAAALWLRSKGQQDLADEMVDHFAWQERDKFPDDLGEEP